MKKALIIVTVCLFLLTSCASFPPPEISNGRYTNYKYGFNIEVPDGWLQTEKIPPWLKNTLPEEKSSQIRIMFFNNDSNGLICIMCSKTIWSLDLIRCASEKIEKNLHKLLEKQKKKLSKDLYVKNYSYKIYNIENWCDQFSYETEFDKMEMRSEYIMYGCQGDDTCIVGIELISDIKTFDENYKVFNSIVDSFRKFEYIPENKTEDVSEALIKNLLPTDWVGEILGWWSAGGM